MDIQRIRNLTTRKLHTEMSHIYEDIEYITGEKGIMTHQLPGAADAMMPFLKSKLTDERFWDKKYDPSHKGDIPFSPMNEDERVEFFKAFGA